MGDSADVFSMRVDVTGIANVSGVDCYVDMVGNSTPARADTGFQPEVFTFRGVLSLGSDMLDNYWVVDTAFLRLCNFSFVSIPSFVTSLYGLA